MPGHQPPPAVQDGEQGPPPLVGEEEGTPDAEEGSDPVVELETPPEIPVIPVFPESPPEDDPVDYLTGDDDLDDYVADGDDRIPNDDLDDVEGSDPEFDPCLVLEQVVGY